MPRCDLLAWILVVKLAPTYYRKLDRLLTDTGRYRELPSWRKTFKREWRKLEKKPITLPVNPAYKTDAKKMLCTCPSLPTSRFLLCKHTVQGVKPVPPVFSSKSSASVPHHSGCILRYGLCPTHLTRQMQSPVAEPSGDDGAAGTGLPDAALESDADDDDDLVDTQPANENQPTFLEAMDENIDVIQEFVKGLKYQRQFRDQRMLESLEREGASFLRMARACLEKERRLKSTRGATPSTWDKSFGSAMFYRARPTRSDENT
ncbi:hypothetical protein B0H13DRAFT_2445222 [Mycena leptocephala]|nr:hypothetical protein B0H13DRAFT_2445222 [Mycena leptocephala]